MRLQLFREFSPTKTAYDNLLNNGGVNLIANAHLLKLLATYHFEEPFNKRTKDQRDRLTNEYDPFRIKYLSSGALRAFLKEEIFGQSALPPQGGVVDWDNLRKDEDYRHLLEQILAMQVPARWRLVEAKKSINELLVEIDKEIESTRN